MHLWQKFDNTLVLIDKKLSPWQGSDKFHVNKGIIEYISDYMHICTHAPLPEDVHFNSVTSHIKRIKSAFMISAELDQRVVINCGETNNDQ